MICERSLEGIPTREEDFKAAVHREVGIIVKVRGMSEMGIIKTRGIGIMVTGMGIEDRVHEYVYRKQSYIHAASQFEE